MVEHFRERVAHRIEGQAKAMIVTRSRLHAVRYKLTLDAYLKEKGYPYRALVAFSGTVRDAGADFTETGMNGLPEAQTAATFRRSDTNFKFYKRVTDDPEFGRFFLDWLFERFRTTVETPRPSPPSRGPHDAVVHLLGSVDGKDPKRSEGGPKRVAQMLRRRRSR
jgi:hypothetical protein